MADSRNQWHVFSIYMVTAWLVNRSAFLANLKLPKTGKFQISNHQKKKNETLQLTHKGNGFAQSFEMSTSANKPLDYSQIQTATYHKVLLNSKSVTHELTIPNYICLSPAHYCQPN